MRCGASTMKGSQHFRDQLRDKEESRIAGFLTAIFLRRFVGASLADVLACPEATPPHRFQPFDARASTAAMTRNVFCPHNCPNDTSLHPRATSAAVILGKSLTSRRPAKAPP